MLRTLLLAALIALVSMVHASAVQAQVFRPVQGGSGDSFASARFARDLAGQSYTAPLGLGRMGYYTPLPQPGFDERGNGPSMAYSPVFNVLPSSAASQRPGYHPRAQRGPRIRFGLLRSNR